MTPLYRNREQEAAIQNALMTRLQARYERALRKEIGVRMVKAADMYQQFGDIGVDMAMGGHKEALEGILTGLWTTAMTTFAKRIEPGGKSRKTGIIEAAIRMWFQRYAYDVIVSLRNTTIQQVREIITAGIGGGLSQSLIGKKIEQVAPQLSAYRANVIARTETHGASQYGSISGAREIDSTLKKEWISVEDGRTRTIPFDHAGADGEIVPLDKDFTRTGESLEYPGGPGGSAGNVINCRCVIGYVR